MCMKVKTGKHEKTKTKGWKIFWYRQENLKVTSKIGTEIQEIFKRQLFQQKAKGTIQKGEAGKNTQLEVRSTMIARNIKERK